MSVIDGRENGYNIFADVREQAKSDGLVIVYGQSDDLMEFDGAIYDEADAWRGCIVYLNEDGIFKPPSCDCNSVDCPYLEGAKRRMKKIEAVWSKSKQAPWTYKTDIPHSTFRIMEGGEVFCVGIVFELEALKDNE